MPFFGLELLGMARDVAAFNLPARVGQLFGAFPRVTTELITFAPDRMLFAVGIIRRHDLGWAIIHWFELGILALLCLNLWSVSSVLNALRETNHWLAFLTRVRWDEIHGPENPE